jgi:hypothetical protein
VGTCALAHDDVACFVVDDDADADEGAGEIGHDGFVWGVVILQKISCYSSRMWLMFTF